MTTKTATNVKGSITGANIEAPEVLLALNSVVGKVASDARKTLEYVPGEPIKVDARVHIVGSITVGEETEATPPLPDVEGLVALLMAGLSADGIVRRTPLSSGEWSVSIEDRARAADLIRKIKNRLTPVARSGAVRCQCELTIEQ